MSELPLIERLKRYSRRTKTGATRPPPPVILEAAARIAELESAVSLDRDLFATMDKRIADLIAERDVANQSARDKAEQYVAERKARDATIAERDRLKAALRHIATTADIGLNIGPVIRMAKAALAPAEGEGR